MKRGGDQLLPAIPEEQWLYDPERIRLVALEPEAGLFYGVGIENNENNCYINAIMNCLFYSVPLRAMLLAERHARQCRVFTFCALCEVERFFDKIMTLNPKYYVASLWYFLHDLPKLGEFRRGQQEDASLFLTGLCMAMQRAEFAARRVTPTHDQENTTGLHQLFGGHVGYTNRCKNAACGHTTRKHEYFFTLPLALEASTTLVQMLTEHFGGEEVAEWRCPTCRNCGLERRKVLCQAHPLLVIQLMRFDFERNKISVPIEFGALLDMGPYFVDANQTDLLYDLYAVVVHRGRTLDSGHYVAYVRVGAKWHLTDDEKNCEVTEAAVLAENAHLLFYRRRLPGARVAAAAAELTPPPDTAIATPAVDAAAVGGADAGAVVVADPVAVHPSPAAVAAKSAAVASCPRCTDARLCSLHALLVYRKN